MPEAKKKRQDIKPSGTEHPTDDMQIRIFKSMPPEKKLKIAMQMYWSVRSLKAAGIRHSHPDWAEERVEAEVRRIFLYGIS